MDRFTIRGLNIFVVLAISIEISLTEVADGHRLGPNDARNPQPLEACRWFFHKGHYQPKLPSGILCKACLMP